MQNEYANIIQSDRVLLSPRANCPFERAFLHAWSMSHSVDDGLPSVEEPVQADDLSWWLDVYTCDNQPSAIDLAYDMQHDNARMHTQPHATLLV